MALLLCRECAKPVSTEAAACPHCGAPPPPRPEIPPAVNHGTQYTTGQAIAIIACATVALFGIIIYDHHKVQPKSREEVPPSPVCAKNDLECLGNRALGSASVYCRSHIERQAAHSVKWTDGMLEQKFSRFRWHDPVAGSITFIGDRAEFQNGFGAFTPVIYECDLAADEKTVLDARVQEGRLR